MSARVSGFANAATAAATRAPAGQVTFVRTHMKKGLGAVAATPACTAASCRLHAAPVALMMPTATAP